MKIAVLLSLGLIMLLPNFVYSQDVMVKIGQRDSVASKILNENRKLIVSLPKGYETSNKDYPVLYLLDGVEISLIDARSVTRNLKMETIIVAIANTDRDRDMMPLSRPSYEVKNPQAENFLLFLEKELVPHIDKNYRTNKTRTIRGRSLSGLFVMYAFLSKPTLFDNYVGTCAGWFKDMDDYFSELADEAFKDKDNFKGKTLFVANSLSDPLDPKGEIHQSVINSSKTLKSALADRINFQYKTYENAGHVPYSGLYDGMKYISEQMINKKK
ncbi:alpha/beta hydrolase [Winogradskyella luteola]|uniref:Alpha/beta hydrolase n=1 Tax=Winogradskyella luteola TaxID=2828330 RepID=A0A9X1FBW2_9FLAO|nr:alpha/beta hydrolase-fold protein [Winogradskyella luteola]MBV7269870.1 alpha/beta hydrolase [Winogradskyella luteola]